MKDFNGHNEMIGILCKLCINRETTTGAYKYWKNLEWELLLS